MSSPAHDLLESWWLPPNRQALLRHECRLAQRLLALHSGELVLQVGGLRMTSDFWQAQPGRLQGWLVASAQTEVLAPAAVVVTAWESLPLETASVDGFWLPHTLETLVDPQPLLAELARILVPGGRLLVTMLNPWQYLGLNARYHGLRPLSPFRLAAQLDQQGLTGLQIWGISRQGLPTHPINWPGGWLGAASYLLLAEKRTVGLTPLRLSWPSINFGERLYEPAA